MIFNAYTTYTYYIAYICTQDLTSANSYLVT